MFRPRPKNARRHWPMLGGRRAVIGGSPRAGSISHRTVREVVETQFKSRSGGSPGGFARFCFPFLHPFPKTPIRTSSTLLCAVSFPRPCLKRTFPPWGRSPSKGPSFMPAARTRGWAFLSLRTLIYRRMTTAFPSPKARPEGKEKERLGGTSLGCVLPGGSEQENE